MQLVSLDELYEMERKHDPSLVFHGTASCYSEKIESQGWPVNWRPYAWEDIEYVMHLGKSVQISPNAFLLHNHEVQRIRRPHNSGAYFTYEVAGALQYSGATGGETVRNSLRLANQITEVLRNEPGHEDDLTRLGLLTSTWKSWVSESVPIIYAVRATDEAFPDQKFVGLVSRSKQSFSYQLKNFGEILQKHGDFWATQSIAPSAIVAKATLSSTPIEAL